MPSPSLKEINLINLLPRLIGFVRPANAIPFSGSTICDEFSFQQVEKVGVDVELPLAEVRFYYQIAQSKP